MKTAALKLLCLAAITTLVSAGVAVARCPLEDFAKVCLHNSSKQELLTWVEANGWKILGSDGSLSGDGFLRLQSSDGLVFVSDFVDFDQVVHMECSTTLETPVGFEKGIVSDSSGLDGKQFVVAPPAWGAPTLQCLNMKDQLQALLPTESVVLQEAEGALKLRTELDGNYLIVIGSQAAHNASHSTFTATKIIFREGS
ncbi:MULTISPECIES: hypothetical protein [Stappiaceae]|uniref:Uncharacterized protein n=1 Tax=Roseibium aggregatum TaxID=187304 RepID=A0A0M6Y404_9HYPH|nr:MULTISPECIES: hypothetical protein [Stappiaceae]ERP97215.1 hypothetical protein Q669_24865 [Labrenzia sp. C1B10]CTQ44398.1 hypothetical protein LAL4801_02841 [Roseibium aggregatum]